MSTDAVKSPRKTCGSFGGRNSAGNPCGQMAVAGTQRCRNHAGKPLVKAKAEGRLRLAVEHWNPDTLPPVKDVTGEAIRLITVTKRIHADLLAALRAETMDRDLAALVGVSWSEGGKSGEYVTGLAQLEQIERDRLWRFLKDYRQAGYDERRLELEERQIDQLDRILRAVLTDNGIDVNDPMVIEGVVRRMRELSV